MLNYQIITDATGKILAVLSYCTVTLAQKAAREYARVLGCNTYRLVMRVTDPPQVGTTLPQAALAAADLHLYS